ncbi:MAG TPA: hypothetical protein VFZ09_02670 [Archangium sp.]|uniref:hypothetical protein n=1 Tax=Archangium sp. TaxID=1872627 RepID=UPI002E347A26|nr:hypothetical protein [Archangium sp.]HEX5745116.1 hypothetical protein [Archangium sp.]
MIAGLGARTPVGTSAPMSAASVRAGIVRFAEHPFMVDGAGAPMVVSAASYVPATVLGLERYLALAVPAMMEALEPLAQVLPSLRPVPVALGLPLERSELPPRSQVASRLEAALEGPLEGRVRISRVHSAGHAAGLLALQTAAEWLNQGAELCLVGGVESYIEPEILEWLDRREQLKSQTHRWGFVPGEAAAFCLVASERVMSRYGLRPLARVTAVASAIEQDRPDTGRVCTGIGLTRALQGALAALPSGAKVDHVFGDLNGERSRADEYGFSIARLGERFVDATEVCTPADCWGDVGAASGPLFVNLAVAARLRRYARGPWSLLWTSSESGDRCAALVGPA